MLSTLRRLRRAPDDHVEHLLLLEDAADEQPLDEGGLGAADVARLDPELPGPVEIDLDLHVRLLDRLLEARIDDALDLRHERLHLARLAAEDVEILAKDAHDERVLGLGVSTSRPSPVTWFSPS